MTILVLLLVASNLTWLAVLARVLRAKSEAQHVLVTLPGEVLLEVSGYSPDATVAIIELIEEMER